MANDQRIILTRFDLRGITIFVDVPYTDLTKIPPTAFTDPSSEESSKLKNTIRALEFLMKLGVEPSENCDIPGLQ